MRYAGIIKNDITAGHGFSLTVFTQGCPHHCLGCHNPETWAYSAGKEFTNDTLEEIILGITQNGIHRNLAIMGGEPLCERNLGLTLFLIDKVREIYPEQKIFIWTGYTIEQLIERNDPITNTILKNIDILVDGPFIQELKDVRLPMRGSKNQRILEKKDIKEFISNDTV